MGNLGRKPDTSNDPVNSSIKDNSWIKENDIDDTFSLLLQGRAKRCLKCKRPARLKYLDENQLCPDCRENSSTPPAA